MKAYTYDVTGAVSNYIKQKGILITALSEGTGIPYGALQPSMSCRRKLRADEFLAICNFLEVAPEKFIPEDKSISDEQKGK